MDEALEDLPRDLDDAFSNTLRRIQSQSNGQSTLGMATLMWLAYARRPLDVAELSEALAIKPGSTSLNLRFRPSQKRMVDCCMGLVTVDERTSVIRLVHYAVQEYLYHYSDESFARGESTIAEACITYLLFEPFASGPRQLEEDVQEMVSTNFFVRYAACHWGFHVRAANDRAIDKLAFAFLQAETQRGCSIQISEYLANRRDEYWNEEEARSCNGLHIAAIFGLLEIGKQLLDTDQCGVDDATEMGTTALINAASNGHQQFTEMLLGMQADTTKRNWYGTALHCAAEANQVSTISALLKTGLDVNILDQFGRTSLHCAAMEGHTSAIKFLLEHGAAVSPTQNTVYTPLYYAVALELPLEIVQLLLDHGAETDSHKTNGYTAFHYCVMRDAVAVALLLLEHGANVNVRNIDGDTPLHMAASRDNATMVQHLLDHGANINATTSTEEATALYLAVERGARKTIEVLLRNGADTECKDREGNRPIDVAASEGYEHIVQLLSGAGSQVLQRTKSSDSAARSKLINQNPAEQHRLLCQSLDCFLSN